jgi:hypothetical protein
MWWWRANGSGCESICAARGAGSAASTTNLFG